MWQPVAEPACKDEAARAMRHRVVTRGTTQLHAKTIHGGNREAFRSLKHRSPDFAVQPLYSVPLIERFSNSVSGTGGRMPRAWWGLMVLYWCSHTLMAHWACRRVWNHSALSTSRRSVPINLIGMEVLDLRPYIILADHIVVRIGHMDVYSANWIYHLFPFICLDADEQTKAARERRSISAQILVDATPRNPPLLISVPQCHKPEENHPASSKNILKNSMEEQKFDLINQLLLQEV